MWRHEAKRTEEEMTALHDLAAILLSAFIVAVIALTIAGWMG